MNGKLLLCWRQTRMSRRWYDRSRSCRLGTLYREIQIRSSPWVSLLPRTHTHTNIDCINFGLTHSTRLSTPGFDTRDILSFPVLARYCRYIVVFLLCTQFLNRFFRLLFHPHLWSLSQFRFHESNLCLYCVMLILKCLFICAGGEWWGSSLSLHFAFWVSTNICLDCITRRLPPLLALQIHALWHDAIDSLTGYSHYLLIASHQVLFERWLNSNFYCQLCSASWVEFA